MPRETRPARRVRGAAAGPALMLGAVDHTSGAMGHTAGAVGRIAGAVGRTAGAVGRIAGAVGRTAGAVGRMADAVGRTVGAVGRTVGASGRMAGAAVQEPRHTRQTATTCRSSQPGELLVQHGGGPRTFVERVEVELLVGAVDAVVGEAE